MAAFLEASDKASNVGFSYLRSHLLPDQQQSDDQCLEKRQQRAQLAFFVLALLRYFKYSLLKT